MDGEKIRVGLGEMKTGRGHEVLTCIGVGSGVALCVYDARAKVGAMAHVVLVEPPAGISARGARYASHAIPALVEAVSNLGGDPAHFCAVLAGAARMIGGEDAFLFGEKTAERLRTELVRAGVMVLLDETGGSITRTLSFDVAAAKVEIRAIAAPPMLCELQAA